MRPKFSGRKLRMKTFAFGEMCLYYGAFGAKGPAGAGQKILRNFFKKVDFWRVPANGSFYGHFELFSGPFLGPLCYIAF